MPQDKVIQLHVRIFCRSALSILLCKLYKIAPVSRCAGKQCSDFCSSCRIELTSCS